MRAGIAFPVALILSSPLGANCFLLPLSVPRKANQSPFIRPKLPLVSSMRSKSETYLSSNPFLNSPLAMTSSASANCVMIRAALTLLLSAGAGIVYDKKRGGGLGTLVTFLVAAHAGNLNLGPSHHVLYNFCWTTLLPSSLALLLLASPSSKDRQSSRKEIRAVAVPFMLASIGSILGCLLAFFLTLLGAVHSSGKRLGRPGRLLLPPTEGAVQAGCLCASFIGGPVNYFGVRHLLASSDTLLGYDGGVLDSLFGSSISDLLVMAVYFSISTTALKLRLLQKWFPERQEDSIEGDTSLDIVATFSKRRRIGATIMAAFLAREMVKVSVAFGEAIHIPGFTTMSLAGLGAMCSNVLPRVLSIFGADALSQQVRTVSISLSDTCFYLLFAAIGASANLKEAVKLGGWHFASGALFASMALLVHVFVLLSSSFAIQRFTSIQFGLEEILVASNAAIGGPLTAAEFANRTKRQHRRGLIMAGTVWGVFGYVIATEVGISLTRILLPLLPLEWR